MQLVGQIAESTISGVGRVTNEVRMARMEAAAVAAKVESAKRTIQSQAASFSVQAEASAVKAVEMMEGHVQQLVAHSDAQMSHVTREII